MPTSRLEKLRNRRLDPLLKVGGLNEAYKRLTTEDSAVQYTIGAMQSIDPDYTRNTIEERNRVENQLADGYRALGIGIEFDYQGSVTNDTHIRAHSDVDLLTVEQRFVCIQPPNPAVPPYQGDPVADLRQIRKSTVSILKSAYPAANIDDSGSKSVNISGGSLRRKIDVVASNWWHTLEYVREGHKHWLGVEVLDNGNGIRIANKPFLHNKRIAEKDQQSNGGLRKLIRLLKSLKYDSDDAIELTSYDIAGIVYNMRDEELYAHPGRDLILVNYCHSFLLFLEYDPATRERILVPNSTRKVFCAEGATEKGLHQMRVALGILLVEIEQGLSRSFRKLAEARITY